MSAEDRRRQIEADMAAIPPAERARRRAALAALTAEAEHLGWYPPSPSPVRLPGDHTGDA